ncbi:hypothetical protein BXZ70DRAFT_1012766 [Cristinia sonorae]|uniref:Uncharacterized protein n=1 Tax=Cristinia sonorae TaxID=1940300 RepID=A0A8K0UDJ9_9AGAR|nr:hypothetical protein BXZ70DRAFT_1012766 [Cristinia sonorae]
MNLTALAVAASAITILDFQSRALDLTNGVANDFVPVQAFSNLGWILTSTTSTGASPFKISNTRTGTVLSYPSANVPGLTSVGNVIRQQVMAHSVAATTWDVTAVVGGFKIVEAATGLALTSWGADPSAASASNPVTLEAPVANDAQQIFSIINGLVFVLATRRVHLYPCSALRLKKLIAVKSGNCAAFATAVVDSGMPIILASLDIANGTYGALGIGPASDRQCESPVFVFAEIPLHLLDLTTTALGSSNSHPTCM